MEGRPVWLASISRATREAIIPNEDWTKFEKRSAEHYLNQTLEAQGDARFERLFRMQVTYCMHRALNAYELRLLPASFHEAQNVDLAGGPVEILRETVPGLTSTKPCKDFTKHPIPENPKCWVPIDCGKCAPCLARIEHEKR